MALTTPDFSDNDLQDGWTVTGATAVDDQHNLLAGASCDGANDKLSRAGVVTTETAVTVGAWIKTTQTGSQGLIMGQYTSNSQGQFIFRIELSGYIGLIARDTDGVNNKALVSSDTVVADDNWHWVVARFEPSAGNDCALFVDGVKETTFITDTGTFTQFGTTLANLTLGERDDGANDFNGVVSRPRVWLSALSDAEISEEYTAEYDAVFVPSNSFTYTDLNDSPFTANGGFTLADDQHNPSVTGVLAGTDDYYSSTVKPFTNGSGLDHTFRIWFKADSPTTNSLLLAQHSGAADRGFLVIVNTTMIVEFSPGGSGAWLRSEIAAGMLSWDDGNWHLLHGRIKNGNNIQIFIDGTEVTSYVSQNTGTGFTGFGTNIDNLAIGANSAGAAPFFLGTPSRPSFWPSVDLSDAQINKDYDNEVAAIGEGLFNNEKFRKNTLLLHFS